MSRRRPLLAISICGIYRRRPPAAMTPEHRREWLREKIMREQEQKQALEGAQAAANAALHACEFSYEPQIWHEKH